MDPIISSILTSVATGYFVNFSTSMVKTVFKKIIDIEPSFSRDLLNAKTSIDFEKVFSKTVGIIDALAGRGTIEVDSSFLSALRGIRFNHQDGTVEIEGSVITAPIISTGGKGKGTTRITDTSLKSRGTKIDVNKNASIKISGDAEIQQS